MQHCRTTTTTWSLHLSKSQRQICASTYWSLGKPHPWPAEFASALLVVPNSWCVKNKNSMRPINNPYRVTSESAERNYMLGEAKGKRNSANSTGSESRCIAPGWSLNAGRTLRTGCREEARFLDHHCLVILAVHVAHGVGDFADRGVGFHGFDNHRHQVSGSARRVFNLLDRGLPLRLIAFGAHGTQALHLAALQRLVNPLQRDGFLIVEMEGVHPHDDGFLVIDRPLILVGGVLDLLLDEPALDGLQRAAHGFNLIDVGTRACFNLVGQRFNVVRARERVNGLRRA